MPKRYWVPRRPTRLATVVAENGAPREPGAGGDRRVEARAGAVLQQQLVDLLALGVAAKQARWTLRGPGSPRVLPLLQSFEGALDQLSDDLAGRMGDRGLLPNGTLPAQLIAVVPSRIPGWWPAGEAAAQLAADTSLVVAAMTGRIDSVRPWDPVLAGVLRHQAELLRTHGDRLRPV